MLGDDVDDDDLVPLSRNRCHI